MKPRTMYANTPLIMIAVTSAANAINMRNVRQLRLITFFKNNYLCL